MHSIKSAARRCWRERSCRSRFTGAPHGCLRAIFGLPRKKATDPNLNTPCPAGLGRPCMKYARKNKGREDWMRQNTLAEPVERIQAGSAQNVELAEFVDTFDLTKTNRDRYASIEDEPKLTGDARLDALVGAIAEYLAKQRRLGRVPRWVSDPARRLSSPWFTTASPSDAMREYLTFSSPAEFASRNIFTEERPLRRARGPPPAKM